MADEVLDVAVVGAGVSGVYVAWRLNAARRSVQVFEAGDHVGGRLLSVNPPEIGNMTAELGGMRILPEVQPRIAALIDELNQHARGAQRIETFKFPVDEPENIAFLRGVHLRLADFTQHPDKVPYRLGFLEHGQAASTIIINAIERIVPGITAKGLTEAERRRMTQNAKFDGKMLYEQGFWQVLIRVISGEAYQLGLDAGGYQTTLTSWNAADAIPWYLSDFGVGSAYHGFRQGFQQVPLTLAQRFTEAGGTIHLNTKLVGFEESGEGVALRFEDGSEVRAKALVLAMPRRSLDLISGGCSFLQRPEVAQLVGSVTPRPLFKLFTTYTHPWWMPAQVKQGRTVTDLPVRQTYYWPTDDGTPPGPCDPAMLMASYDDGLNIGFWDGFRPKRGKGWRPGAERKPDPDWFENADAPAGPSTGTGDWEEYRAPRDMVEEVQRQLARIHGMPFVPGVRNAAFKDWGDDPFGGGWNSWNIGVQSQDVIRKIVQPVQGVPVHICGEAYSNAQGWVEGALETADLVLRHFGLAPLANDPGTPS
ncbi:MAG TPA: NAD(P)/FAD-dependent oxidoreductase [Longimicrobium sp.]|nr:NAD(P)/FAD-dependent oxidoreductase [Longimicrobium sp.]